MRKHPPPLCAGAPRGKMYKEISRGKIGKVWDLKYDIKSGNQDEY